MLTDTEEMALYLERQFAPPLRSPAGPAHDATRNVFSKFSFLIKGVAATPEALLRELRHVDDQLASSASEGGFLCGKGPTQLDCAVLPKLQHIRVATRAFKDLELPPTDMKALWAYLERAYAHPAFRKTCPSDQEIVHWWSEKRETTPLPAERRKFYTVETKPRFSMDVPEAAK